ncbi:hypothetical protein ACH5RR_006858 [Cinchona calisaya]|uniref:Large ribosomal subunit protein uL11 N-terminal domain-containing protein n=1 Tax=Cinchona calisaya TaxID=153742 RepID=A0ABD3AQJ9_9GENT
MMEKPPSATGLLDDSPVGLGNSSTNLDEQDLKCRIYFLVLVMFTGVMVVLKETWSEGHLVKEVTFINLSLTSLGNLKLLDCLPRMGFFCSDWGDLGLGGMKATSCPPVGLAFSFKGVNIMAFFNDDNARTAGKAGYVIAVEITIYDASGPFLLSNSNCF